MKSKALTLVAILACAAVILIGCGGGGGGGGSTGSGGTSASTTSTTTGSTTSTTTGGGVNQFDGRWDGTFTQATPTDSGTITLAIAGNGAVSGDTHDANLNEEGILSGLITNGGSMSFKVKYPSQTQIWSGTATKNSSGHMVGTMNVSASGSTSSFNFDLTPF